MQEERCDGCGLVSCDDWGLCDVVTPSTPLPPKRHTADQWRAQYHELYGGTPEPVWAAELRSEVTLEVQDSGGRYAGRDAIVRTLRIGATLQDIAKALGLSLAQVVARVADSEPNATIAAEALLRAGATSYLEVARQVGLTRQQVARLAEVLGLRSARAATLASGGTFKYTPHQLRTVRELRSGGASYGTVAAAIGVSKDSAAGLCRRLGLQASQAAA